MEDRRVLRLDLDLSCSTMTRQSRYLYKISTWHEELITRKFFSKKIPREVRTSLLRKRRYLVSLVSLGRRLNVTTQVR